MQEGREQFVNAQIRKEKANGQIPAPSHSSIQFHLSSFNWQHHSPLVLIGLDLLSRGHYHVSAFAKRLWLGSAFVFINITFMIRGQQLLDWKSCDYLECAPLTFGSVISRPGCGYLYS